MAALQIEQLKNKLVQKLQNTKFLKELREFDSLIKAIGECKSKSEEDRIILAEIETLKQRLSDPKIDKARGREYVVRLIYCEMLGHDTSWAYVKTLQFASEPNILTKKAAYLALTQFFDQNHELVLLLVNTLLSDLKSDNFINVCTALVVCTKLIGPDLINAVYPLVVERLKHPKEHVRKKAIMALHRFHQLDPKRDGPLSGLDLDKHFRTMLCDKDPGVMSAALCALHDVVKGDPAPYKNLIPSFTSILKQVSEHRLPKSYDYHRFPAPFVQIKLLKILSLLGAGDRGASENMYTVVQQTLRRANSSHTIGNAIIFECVTTITTIFPNPHLLSAAAEAVAAFLKSPSHNLRYVGIDALAGIIKINPQAAQEHQLAVVDCLEDPDDTLKLKTLELLYKMTKSSNVEVIVERMITYLRTVTDEHVKRDITRKVSELAERYAPSPAWFIQVVSDVCELGGDHVEPGLAHSLTHLIAEQDTELHRSAVEQYSKLLDVPVGRNLPDVLLQVMVWVLGEYGILLGTSTTGKQMPVQQVMSKLVSLVSRQKCSDLVRQLLPPALAKLAVQGRVSLPPDVEAWVNKISASQSVELQQRAYELQALLTAPQQVQVAVVPHDASCEEFDEAELTDLKHLTFLSWYVDKALQSGASPYVPPQSRQATHTTPDRHALRFEAYEAAPVPASSTTHTPTAASSAAHHSSQHPSHDFLGDSLYGAAQPAMGAAAASSSQPQLVGAGGKAGTRWGPAQFDPPSRGGGSGYGGGEPPARGASPAPAAAARPAPPPSERDRLAASLFSGVGAGGGRGAAAAVPPPLPARAAPAPDLLSLDDSPPARAAPARTPPPPSAAMGLDLLMDLGSPGLSAPPPPAAAGGFGQLDMLLGDLGPVPNLPQVSGVGGLGLGQPMQGLGGGGGMGMGQPGLQGMTQPGGMMGYGAGVGFVQPGGMGMGGGLGMPMGQSQPMGTAGMGEWLGQGGMGSMTGVQGQARGQQATGQVGMGGMQGGMMGMGGKGMGQQAAGAGAGGAFQGLAQAQISSMGKPMTQSAAPAAAPAAADPFAGLF